MKIYVVYGVWPHSNCEVDFIGGFMLEENARLEADRLNAENKDRLKTYDYDEVEMEPRK